MRERVADRKSICVFAGLERCPTQPCSDRAFAPSKTWNSLGYSSVQATAQDLCCRCAYSARPARSVSRSAGSTQGYGGVSLTEGRERAGGPDGTQPSGLARVPVQALLGRARYEVACFRTVGRIPALSLFRAVHCDSISTGPLLSVGVMAEAAPDPVSGRHD